MLADSPIWWRELRDRDRTHTVPPVYARMLHMCQRPWVAV